MLLKPLSPVPKVFERDVVGDREAVNRVHREGSIERVMKAAACHAVVGGYVRRGLFDTDEVKVQRVPRDSGLGWIDGRTEVKF